MIIKCPKCKNVFLAPDDLQEGQMLKCGKCNHSWQLKQAINEIPASIKPNKDESSLTSSARKRFPILQNLANSIFILLILCIICFSLRKEIVRIWQPANYVFESLGSPVSNIKGEGLQFVNVSSEIIENIVYINGSIINNTNSEIEVPVIHIGDNLSVKADDLYLNSGNKTKFRAILNDSSKKEITIYF